MNRKQQSIIKLVKEGSVPCPNKTVYQARYYFVSNLGIQIYFTVEDPGLIQI